MRVHIPDSRHVFYKEGYGQDTFVGAGNRRIGSMVLKLLDNRASLKTEVFRGSPIDILEALNLSEFKDVHPMALSGGQKQRLAIASAIAADKEFLIFDEPTSGLDYAHMRDVAENITRLARAGKTVFIISHDPELIAACCNYLIFMDGGKLVWSGGWSEAIMEKVKAFFEGR